MPARRPSAALAVEDIGIRLSEKTGPNRSWSQSDSNSDTY